MKTKIGTEVAHFTRDSDTTKGQGHQAALLTAVLARRVRWLQRWAWEHVSCGKLLLLCGLLGGARRFGNHGGGEGQGHIVAAACLQLVAIGDIDFQNTKVLFCLSV